jgi:N-glycosidase YbiA
MQFKDEFEFLSNFYPCRVVFDGIEYPSAEHAYQAAKTVDVKMRKQIAACETAGKAKRMGRTVELRPEWDSFKPWVMMVILKSKFSNQELLAKLRAVDEPIVEHNTWGDTYWGVCDGVGQNMLGFLLELIRDFDPWDN